MNAPSWLRTRPRSIRTRLLLFIGVTLVAVCAAMAVTTVLLQRAYLVGDLDERVGDAAERSLGGALLQPEREQNLGFLSERGQPAGLLAARLDAEGALVSAAVVGQDAAPRSLTGAQRATLAGVEADGSMNTRTVPGLGTYRITALDGDGVRVLTGLPMDDLQQMISGMAVAEAVVAAAGLTVAGWGCAVIVRRQLRPLGRVAATAAEVARAPLDRGEATGLTRSGTPTPPARPARSAPPSTADTAAPVYDHARSQPRRRLQPRPFTTTPLGATFRTKWWWERSHTDGPEPARVPLPPHPSAPHPHTRIRTARA
nr:MULTISPECIES: hypothetical protein [unclassified Streptomyces]